MSLTKSLRVRIDFTSDWKHVSQNFFLLVDFICSDFLQNFEENVLLVYDDEGAFKNILQKNGIYFQEFLSGEDEHKITVKKEPYFHIEQSGIILAKVKDLRRIQWYVNNQPIYSNDKWDGSIWGFAILIQDFLKKEFSQHFQFPPLVSLFSDYSNAYVAIDKVFNPLVKFEINEDRTTVFIKEPKLANAMCASILMNYLKDWLIAREAYDLINEIPQLSDSSLRRFIELVDTKELFIYSENIKAGKDNISIECWLPFGLGGPTQIDDEFQQTLVLGNVKVFGEAYDKTRNIPRFTINIDLRNKSYNFSGISTKSEAEFLDREKEISLWKLRI